MVSKPQYLTLGQSVKRHNVLPSAEHFITMWNDCEKVFSERLDLIEESQLAMDNKLGDKLQELFKTKSRYASPDAIIAKQNLHESLTSAIPFFMFRPASKIDVKKIKSIHAVMRKLISIYGLDIGCIQAIGDSLDTGVGFSEIIVEEVRDSGWKIERGEDGVDSMEMYDFLRGHAFSMRNFQIIKDEVRVAPTAGSFNPGTTAPYIIVKDGLYTMTDIEKLAKDKAGQKGWNLKAEHNFMGALGNAFNDFRAVNQASKDGISLTSIDAAPMHKIYYSDGTVDWILGRSYVIAKGIPNNKLIGEMPIITTMLMPNSKHPYGMNLWELMKHAVNLKSGVVNLAADAGVKNINASLITDSMTLSKTGEGSALFSNKIISMEDDGRDVRQRFAQLQVQDMTPALNMLLQIGATDSQRLGRVPDVMQGFQQKQIRTAGVAELMASGNLSAKSMMVKLAEHTLYKTMGGHMLKALYNHFPKFEDQLEGLEREDLTFNFIRVKQGSSLEEDRLSHIELLGALKQEAANMPYDFELTDIMRDFYEENGLYEFDAYLADDQKKLVKLLLSMGIAQDMAVGMSQQIGQVAAQSTGGGNVPPQ